MESLSINPLNSGFYNVTNTIISLQGYFINAANAVARIVLLVAICLAALNYVLMGTGLKENIVRIGKALAFYFVVIGSYPAIVNYIVGLSYTLAYDSVYKATMENTLGKITTAIRERDFEEDYHSNSGYKYTSYSERLLEQDANSLFSDIFVKNRLTIKGKAFEYETVAPSAALDAVRLVVEACLGFSDSHARNIATAIKGLICAGVVIFAGVMALIEYLAAYLEFLLVSSVGVILFPLSLWEGSKFMAEKFIGAMLGFFLKLLFATIGIFFLLYGYLSLAASFSINKFTGLTPQIIEIVFVSFLYLFIVKSAPHLAQGLLSGVPTLSAAGAIGAVTSAVGAAAAVGGAAANAAGAGTRTALSGTAALAKAGGAATQALDAAGDRPSARDGFRAALAFTGSLGHSAGLAAYGGINGLTRSLVSRPLLGGQGRGPGDPGLDPNSAPQRLLAYNGDGSRATIAQVYTDSARNGRQFADRHVQPSAPAPEPEPSVLSRLSMDNINPPASAPTNVSQKFVDRNSYRPEPS